MSRTFKASGCPWLSSKHGGKGALTKFWPSSSRLPAGKVKSHSSWRLEKGVQDLQPQKVTMISFVQPWHPHAHTPPTQPFLEVQKWAHIKNSPQDTAFGRGNCRCISITMIFSTGPLGSSVTLSMRLTAVISPFVSEIVKEKTLFDILILHFLTLDLPQPIGTYGLLSHFLFKIYIQFCSTC